MYAIRSYYVKSPVLIDIRLASANDGVFSAAQSPLILASGSFPYLAITVGIPD